MHDDETQNLNAEETPDDHHQEAKNVDEKIRHGQKESNPYP
jgi:hypothetical protein